MNERIKQLAEQAADGMLSYDAEGDWRLSEKEVQKFAELIVKECVGVVATALFAKECSSAIKRHFGD